MISWKAPGQTSGSSPRQGESCITSSSLLMEEKWNGEATTILNERKMRILKTQLFYPILNWQSSIIRILCRYSTRRRPRCVGWNGWYDGSSDTSHGEEPKSRVKTKRRNIS